MVLANNESNARTIRLRDGRQLGYSEFGEPTGNPIFHFHGYPGSRLEGRILHSAAARCNARFIAVDRPGMGLSDFKRARTILDWPDDVVELADFLHINQFAVDGASGGGPYSLACAYKIPERLSHVGVLSGVGPHWDPGEPWMKLNSLIDAENFWLKFSEKMPKPDKKAVLNPQVFRLLGEELFEAFRQGADGPNYERELYLRDWGFKLQDISPTVGVHLWHGELDVNVPIPYGSGSWKGYSELQDGVLRI